MSEHLKISVGGCDQTSVDISQTYFSMDTKILTESEKDKQREQYKWKLS